MQASIKKQKQKGCANFAFSRLNSRKGHYCNHCEPILPSVCGTSRLRVPAENESVPFPPRPYGDVLDFDGDLDVTSLATLLAAGIRHRRFFHDSGALHIVADAIA